MVTDASIIAKSFELKHAHAFIEEQSSHLGEEKDSSVSQWKRKIGKGEYTSLWKTYNILSSDGNLQKYNYMFRIDTIKIFSLMQHMQEKFS